MKGKFLYLELIAAAIAIIGTFYNNNSAPIKILYMVVLLTYSLVCYFAAITKVNVTNKKEVIDAHVHTISWMSLSIMAVGILFQIQHYPGANVMQTVGGLTGLATLLYHIFNINNDSSKDPSTTPPVYYNPQESDSLVDKYKTNRNNKEITKILYKFFGDMRYTHLELVVRLSIALATTAILYYLHIKNL